MRPTGGPLELHDPGLRPEVSIIVCAHGHREVTWACLQALAESQWANVCRAEVILVDDASPDDTADMARGVVGLRLVELEENVGFVRAANAGLRVARGEHVLFLNNDTEPLGRWLDPLVQTLEQHSDALVVGSKLVYPDGLLQEAGGIVFRDGSGWNYGRGWDPFDPRVDFERQVDYVSGASILVRGDFIRDRGGFDERYSPAYYEDTDLCFAARQAGGEVWYQPRSVVLHHEGVSHGRDVASGVKAFQPINQVAFVETWADALEQQSEPGARSVPSARQRASAGRILVIEHMVPTPDRDSGSLRMMGILRSMRELGFAVTYLPEVGWRRPGYTEALQNLGVEVLGGPSEWWAHVTEIAGELTHVWISRPRVVDSFLGRVREVAPHACVIYDTVDLHFLREQREAEVLVDEARRSAAAQRRELELSLMEAADVTVVTSPYERELLAGLTSARIALVPNVHSRYAPTTPARGRGGILFVGGFMHHPNEDAIEWFVTDVMPRVWDQQPVVPVTIVGSSPPQRVLDLASDRVNVTGWVPRTLPYYETARVAVAPLRFGAGVKGKVGEAMSYGVPVVMTPVASEGMGIVSGQHGIVAAHAAEFAQGVLALLQDDDLWTRLSANGRQHIQEHFGPEAMRASVEAALAAGRDEARPA